MRAEILKAVNHITARKKQSPLSVFDPGLRLREDLGFDSLALAELTVRIEAISGVDIFEQGIVRTLGEVEARLGSAKAW